MYLQSFFLPGSKPKPTPNFTCMVLLKQGIIQNHLNSNSNDQPNKTARKPLGQAPRGESKCDCLAESKHDC